MTSPSSSAREPGRTRAIAELARTLGLEQGQRAPLSDVREAVLELRRSKGMVLDPDDHDTWSAAWFFTNPVVDGAELPEGAPAWPQPDGRIKTSAAWLIEQAGFHKGYGAGPVGLSTKHTLGSPTAVAPPPSSCSRWPERSATAWRRCTASAWQRAGARRLRAVSAQ